MGNYDHDRFKQIIVRWETKIGLDNIILTKNLSSYSDAIEYLIKRNSGEIFTSLPSGSHEYSIVSSSFDPSYTQPHS